jgi:hypothetical protein
MIFMGGFYDKLVINKLPSGAVIDEYRSAPVGSDLASAYGSAQAAAGPEILNATMVIPLFLIVAFTALFIYMRRRTAVKLRPVNA